MSRLHEMKIGNIPKSEPSGNVSNRAGTRTTRTMAKTARSLGFNYTPTTTWRSRSQIRTSKMVKSGQIKGMRKQAKSEVSGDTKHL